MYHIILKTWYQERPDERDDEIYGDGFDEMEHAVGYLNDNIKEILEEYPIDGEIIIKYINTPSST